MTHIKGTSPCIQKLAWIFTGKRLLLDDKHRIPCSRCGAKMDKIHKETVTIDICPNCKGVFLDDGEIDKLAKLGAKGQIKTKSSSKKARITGKTKR
jgi:Zn-finger nucleic acid-binding protein